MRGATSKPTSSNQFLSVNPSSVYSEIQDRFQHSWRIVDSVNAQDYYQAQNAARELLAEHSGLEFHLVNHTGRNYWHDLRQTFATRLRGHRVHEYDI